MKNIGVIQYLRVIDCRFIADFFWIGRSRSRAGLEHLSRGQQVLKVVLGGVIFLRKTVKNGIIKHDNLQYIIPKNIYLCPDHGSRSYCSRTNI